MSHDQTRGLAGGGGGDPCGQCMKINNYSLSARWICHMIIIITTRASGATVYLKQTRNIARSCCFHL